MSFLFRRSEPAHALGRFCAIVCGIALTWLCAAFGLFIATTPRCGGSKIHGPLARAQIAVRGIDQALSMFVIDRNRCPVSRDELVVTGYADAEDFVNPWGTSLDFRCSPNRQMVWSAGPDQIHGTADDIASSR